MALAVSHEQLTDAARQIAETRACAERLEARVEALSRELDANTHARVVGESDRWHEVPQEGDRATQVAATDTTVLKARIRVVAATNRDLRKARERGSFREDVFTGC